MHLRLILAAALVGTGVLAGPGGATPVPLPAQLCQEPGGQTDSPPQPRLERAVVAGVPVAVVLPVDYGTSSRRYPVVYLLHGAQGDEDSWVEYGDLMATTARQAATQRAVVVMPKLGVITGFATDWADGHRRDATFLSSTLVRWTDERFRTLRDRRARAIAGYSGGALSAIHVAERAPGVFGSVGVLSGPTDLSNPFTQPATWASFTAEALCAGDDVGAAGPLGDPLTSAEAWSAADPNLHVDRLRRTAVFVSSGNGQPCDAADAANLAYGSAATEPQMRQAAAKLHAALTAERVRHTYQERPCGLHWWTNWVPTLNDFWGVAAAQWRALLPRG
jgi:S-formylglutathione hydrolase FrmB